MKKFLQRLTFDPLKLFPPLIQLHHKNHTHTHIPHTTPTFFKACCIYMLTTPFLQCVRADCKVWAEIEERYCEIAAKRLAQEVFNFQEAP